MEEDFYMTPKMEESFDNIDRLMRESNARLATMMADMQATMQAGIAELQNRLQSRSRHTSHHSHPSHRSHHTSHKGRPRNSDHGEHGNNELRARSPRYRSSQSLTSSQAESRTTSLDSQSRTSCHCSQSQTVSFSSQAESRTTSLDSQSRTSCHCSQSQTVSFSSQTSSPAIHSLPRKTRVRGPLASRKTEDPISKYPSESPELLQELTNQQNGDKKNKKKSSDNFEHEADAVAELTRGCQSSKITLIGMNTSDSLRVERVTSRKNFQKELVNDVSMDKYVADSDSQDQVIGDKKGVKVQSILAEQLGRNDPQNCTFEGSVFIHSNVNSGMRVKDCRLTLYANWDSCNYRLKRADEFTFEYQLDKIRVVLDLNTQSMVVGLEAVANGQLKLKQGLKSELFSSNEESVYLQENLLWKFCMDNRLSCSSVGGNATGIMDILTYLLKPLRFSFSNKLANENAEISRSEATETQRFELYPVARAISTWKNEKGMVGKDQYQHDQRQGPNIDDWKKKELMLFLREAVRRKIQVKKLRILTFGRYWEGRGARKKKKQKIWAVSYRPP